MKKVIVTGSTGFIGIEVSRYLAERGMRPKLMVRRPVRGLLTKFGMVKSFSQERVTTSLHTSTSSMRPGHLSMPLKVVSRASGQWLMTYPVPGMNISKP